MENQVLVNLPRYKCLRCGHEWIPRSDEYPRVCPNPKCHSVYWDRLPKKDNNEGHND